MAMRDREASAEGGGRAAKGRAVRCRAMAPEGASHGMEAETLHGCPINSPINVLAMPNPDHDDDQFPVPDRVDDSIPADSYTIPIVRSNELLATWRTRILGQRTDTGHDALTVLFGVNGLKFLGGGRLDEDLIACHAV